MTTAHDPALDLTDEQREIQLLCREFAAREIRPISLEVDEADVKVPWEVWYKAAGLDLTDEQREIQAVCRDFAAREIRPAAGAIDGYGLRVMLAACGSGTANSPDSDPSASRSRTPRCSCP